MKRRYLTILCAILFMICFTNLSCLDLVHADETSPITVDYVDGSGNNQVTTSAEIIGEVNGKCIPIFDEDEWAYIYNENAIEGTGKVYLVTLPEQSSIKSVHFSEYNLNSARISHYVFSSMFNCFRDVSYSVEFNGSTAGMEDAESEDAYLFDSDFIGVSEKSIENSYGNSYPCYDDYTNYITLSKAIPSSGVKGIIFSVDNRENKRDIVVVQIINSQVLDKSGLEEAVEQIPSSGYYTSDDNWNGKKFSNSGFWNEMINSRAVLNAYEALQSANSQTVIDDAKTSLENALPGLIENLIPIDQVNPTKLYNAKRLYTLSDDDKPKYSVQSLEKYENVRSAVQATYDTLFDSDGNALESNKADRQTEIDAVADALKAAYDDLLGKTSETDIIRWKEAADWVSGRNVVEADYTADSYSALSIALAKIKAIEDEHEDITEILSSKTAYEAYTTAVAQALCAYYQLEEIEAITVHVRIVDNYGIQYPDEAIADPKMANFDDDVTLSANKTIQGLFMPGEGNGNLNTEPDHDPVPRSGAGGLDDTCEHAHTYVYINGKLAIPAIQADPTELARMNPSAGHMDVYYGKDLSVGGYYPSDGIYEDIEDRFPVLKNALHNGDDIVVLRTRAPFMHYYQAMTPDRCLSNDSDASRHVPLSAYYNSFGFLKLDDSGFTDGSVSIKPGESVDINVSLSQSDVITGDKGDADGAKDISVFASEPFETREEAEKAQSFTQLTTTDGEDIVDVLTDADGEASFSLEKEGWYKVSVIGTKGELRVQNTYLSSDILGGFYPSLRVSDSMLVYVSFDEERETLTTEKQAADAVITEADTAKAAYEESKAAAEEASKTPGPEAVAAAEQALTDAEAAKEKADAAKTAADAYLEKVQALEAKKDQMTPTNKTDIEAKLAEAEEMAGAAEKAGDAAAEEMQKASELLDKVTTKADLLACQEEIEQLKSDIQAKQQEIDDLNGEISDLKEQNTANQTKIDNLETEIAEAEGKIASLEESGDNNQEEIEQLKSDIQAKQQKIDDLNEQITANQGEINQLKDKVEAAQSAIDTISQADPLAEARTEAINRVNKYLEDNTNNMLASDADSAELAALKALLTIKDAKTADEITKAADAAIAKFDEKIAAKKAADEKTAKIKAAKAQKVTGLKVKVKKNKATVSWKKNTEVTGYEVYRSNKKKSGYKKIKTLKKNTKIKFVNKKLKKGKKYFYKVRSFTTIDGKAYYGKYTAVKATKKIK